MIVGLYGIQGVYNFGCEAIVRGAYKFINEIYPESKILYFSFSPDYDSKVLADLKIEIVPINRERTIIKRIVNKIYKFFKIQKQVAMFDVNKILEKVDMIVSIGGDIYTIPQVLREQSKYPYYNSLVDFCEKAIKKGKEVVVYGASVGPWGSYQKAIDYNVNALSKYKIILCREEKTIEYLNSLGLNNVVFFPDPAFQIRKQLKNNLKKYIGINLSPLSLKELYGNFDTTYINKLAFLLDKLYEKTGIELMFIPHVLSQDKMDNDMWFMEKIKSNMKHLNHVTIADTSKGFIGIKDYLSQCYVIAAARMHCAINAIDENIPAIFLSYSQKSIGMCRYIYGNDNYLIDLKNIENELIGKITDILNYHELLSKKIATRNDEIKEYYEVNILEVKKIITLK